MNGKYAVGFAKTMKVSEMVREFVVATMHSSNWSHKDSMFVLPTLGCGNKIYIEGVFNKLKLGCMLKRSPYSGFIDFPFSFPGVACHLLHQIWRSIQGATMILKLVTGAPCGITELFNR